MGWEVTTRRGTVGQLHALDLDLARRQIVWMEPTCAGLALGSAQPATDVDQRAATAAGLEVVRRRSGGGAVLVVPGEMLWVDVVVPRGDPWWDDDIGRSMWWLGDAWTAALADVGVDGEVHRTGFRATAWSRSVCFAGVGAGEVVAGGRKLVGISQRRTRVGARLQSMCHLRVRPEMYAGVLAAGPPADELDGLMAAVAIDADVIRRRLTDRLLDR